MKQGKTIGGLQFFAWERGSSNSKYHQCAILNRLPATANIAMPLLLPLQPEGGGVRKNHCYQIFPLPIPDLSFSNSPYNPASSALPSLLSLSILLHPFYLVPSSPTPFLPLLPSNLSWHLAGDTLTCVGMLWLCCRYSCSMLFYKMFYVCHKAVTATRTLSPQAVYIFLFKKVFYIFCETPSLAPSCSTSPNPIVPTSPCGIILCFR